MSLLRTNRIDLMQVHNLVDINTQLATLQEWKQQGRIRYTGITHYESGAFGEIEKLMRSQKFDFLRDQLFADGTRSRGARSAVGAGTRRRCDRESAIWIRRFVRQSAIKTAAGLGGEFDCRSWAQFFLKWIIANPAITCLIPATDKPRHLEDNMQAGIGRLPRSKIARAGWRNSSHRCRAAAPVVHLAQVKLKILRLMEKIGCDQ